MERIGQTLRALFRRALSEHGQEAPALTGIVIDRARGRFEPRLGAQFSNGYIVWADLRAADCYAFCTQHAAWDVDSLQRALLREGQQIYARMRADHFFELSRERVRNERLGGDGGRISLLERLSRGADLLDRDLPWHQRREIPEPPIETESRSRRQETQRRLMAWWTQQRSQLTSSMLFLRGSPSDAGSKKAQERGVQLLRQNLAPAQREQYEKYGYFDVIGGKTGRRYRIRHGRSMNIEQLDKNGRRVCGWCFFPQGGLVAGDVMLAQKMALELFEPDALRIANRF